MEIPVLGTHNEYLASISPTLTIPWEGYHRASLISEQELVQIRSFESSLEGDLAVILQLTLKLSRVDTIQRLLILLDQHFQKSMTTVSLLPNYPVCALQPFEQYIFTLPQSSFKFR
jgi:hypothetical protein